MPANRKNDTQAVNDKERKKKNAARMGAHVSISGGVSKAFGRGVDIGCGAIQIFAKNQSQWKGKVIDDKELEKYHQQQEETGIGPVIIHDSYLINLCAPDPEMYEKSLNAFGDEIDRAEMLRVPYLNFHPGSHLGQGEEWGLKKNAESLNLMIDRRPDAKVMLLIEATAGQGTNLGYRFEQVREIMDGIENRERIGVCIDTAHIFAAGYDLRTEEAYEKTIKELDDIIGLTHVKAFHLNDSKKDLGTRVDRHENIGEGFIGIKAFELLVNDPRFEGIPMILETPGGEEYFKKNLIKLRKLIK